ncbi:hypothetical protein MBSD_n2494 [Mizugakiibacter sediminis]|uniref:Fibronectin type-III domain-containing protein n=1 Tax=Mizugakiibacter sediminis TaxID=1475481 RepID=A0A0K8QQL2_9GAMM|nr:hypothetical protein MBSD_n2494 [Mizugakiibacter sediminis]
MRTRSVLAFLFVFAVTSLTAHAQTADGVEPYEEFGKRLRAAEDVTPLKSDVFGDQVSLYNGATEFDVVDMDIPGNSSLPVQLRRRFKVEDRRKDPGNLYGFGDWDLDVAYIEGTFTQENGWKVRTDNGYDRCTNPAPPNTSITYPATYTADDEQVWNGNFLHIPGSGSEEMLQNTEAKLPKVADGKTYPWVTKGYYQITCLASTKNGYPGEAFVAVSPSGVRYTFDYVVVRAAPDLKLRGVLPGGYTLFLPRSRVFFLVSRIDDRFGNWVTYTYSGDHLTRIASNDGRTIDITWSGNTAVSATSALGTWAYGYSGSSLSSVTRPDGSQWTYATVSGSLVTQKAIDSGGEGSGDYTPPNNHCQINRDPNTGSFTYAVGAPSGATATYAFSYRRHYRDGVPKSCFDGNPNHLYPEVYDFFDNFTIQSKTVTGPGLGSLAWTYTFAESGGPYVDATAPGPYDSSTETYIPPGGCADYSDSKWVVVNGPTGITKYQFGAEYACNEGWLLSTEFDTPAGAALKTVTNTYVGNGEVSSQPFPGNVGVSLLSTYINPLVGRLRPVRSTVTAQDGATFTATTNGYDAFASPVSVTKSSSLGYTRTDVTTYSTNLAKWVIGQVAKVTNSNTSAVVEQIDYDATTALPIRTYAFGKLKATNSYNADGTLASVTDGNSHATTLNSWYRGLPRSVAYADGKGESAVVNDAGWITSLTDENGFTTNYGYDAMGRVNLITYPSGDSTAWNQTQISFSAGYPAADGLPAGHWRQRIITGNSMTETLYDALWRPVIKQRYDINDVNNTLSQAVIRYDANGNVTFSSCPQRSFDQAVTSTWADPTKTPNASGMHTTYDALGRPTQVTQDSELGALTTTTSYLSGLKVKVTNPRGYATTTSFQAFDTPDTSRPVLIQAPEGATTTITRDVFGKPLALTRSGSYGGGTVSATRRYVYDGNQLLCKVIEPETGATLMDYDAAGNLAWTAPGTTLTGTTCDRSSVPAGTTITRSYDLRNRLTGITYPDGISDTTYSYEADGALSSARVENGGSPVVTSYAYNKRRFLTSETLSVPGISSRVIRYAYDANGHLASHTYPSGRVVSYAPNALGQPKQAGSYATGVSYYPNGGIKQFTYGNGIVHAMAQNARQLPDRSTDSYGGTAVLDDAYDYDANGNVAAITDGLPGNIGNRDMTYDGLDRLTVTASPMFGGDNQAVYAYDPLDNIRSARVGSLSQYTYVYDASNRLGSVSGTQTLSFGYDARGNLTNRGGQTIAFDQANRLRAVTGKESYLYDAAGLRVQKTDAASGAVTYFDYGKGGPLMYEWDVAAKTDSDYIYLGGSLVAKVTRNLQPPPAPASISVPSTSNQASFAVSWVASSGATRYVLEESANGGAWTQKYSGGATSTTVSVPASGSYQYRVKACADFCSGYIASGAVAVTLPPSSAPSLNVPASNNTGGYTVSWGSVAGATSYVLSESTNGGTWTEVANGAINAWTASGKTSGTYTYSVAACNAGGCSPWSAWASVVVTLPPGTASTLSGPSSNSTGSYTLSWTTVTGATRYQLNQSINGGAWTAVYNSTGTSWSASGVGTGTYAYVVYACNAGGCSPASSQVTVSVTIPPSAVPTLSGPSSSSTGSYTLTWTSVSGATYYTLKQGVNGGALATVASGAITSWSTSGKGNGSYTYAVWACNAGGCGAQSSATLTVTVLPPAAPASVTAPSYVHGVSYTISWTAVTGATSYDVQKQVGGASIGSTTATSMSFPAPSMTQTLRYGVRACNAAGCSAWTSAPNYTNTDPPGPIQ